MHVFALQMLVLALSLCGPPLAQAELAWATKSADLQANAGTEVLETRFHFTNSGSTPVDIRQVESSCGCTTTELTQRHYLAGQSGDIVARYTVAGRMGLQVKTLAVFSSDRSEPTILTLRIRIPEIAHLQPASVTWAHDEEPKTKTITLAMLQDLPLKDIAVQSSNSSLAATLQTLVPNRTYQITITPSQTKQFAYAILTVRCRFGDQEQSFRAYAPVQPPLSRQ